MKVFLVVCLGLLVILGLGWSAVMIATQKEQNIKTLDSPPPLRNVREAEKNEGNRKTRNSNSAKDKQWKQTHTKGKHFRRKTAKGTNGKNISEHSKNTKRKRKETNCKKVKTKLRRTKKSRMGGSESNKYRRQTCGINQANGNCLQNAVLVLNFEKNQIQNFVKQKARLQNQIKTTANKRAKKGEFEDAAKFLLEAIGGNISAPTCGESGTPIKTKFAKNASENYKTLMNCSNSIADSCSMPMHVFNGTTKAMMDTCAAIFAELKNASEDCRTNKKYLSNGTAACSCWSKTALSTAKAKAEKCSASKTAKQVKAAKNMCITAFSVCKKSEDAVLGQVSTCQAGDVSGSFSVSVPAPVAFPTSAPTFAPVPFPAPVPIPVPAPVPPASTTTAPIITSFVIEEDGEELEQESSYRPDIEVLVMTVPAHKNYTTSEHLLHPNVSMSKSDGTCQVSDTPVYINVTEIAESFSAVKQKSGEKLRQADVEKKYILKEIESVLGSDKREKLLGNVQDACKDLSVSKTIDTEISKSNFEIFENGEIIFIPPEITGRLDSECKTNRSCVQNDTDSCFYIKIESTNTTIKGLHLLGLVGTCIFCLPEPCNTSSLCECQDIKTYDDLVDCGIDVTCTNTRFETCSLEQETCFYRDEESRSVVIRSPANNGHEGLEVAMYSDEQGKWDFSETKNNRLVKLGNQCYVGKLFYQDDRPRKYSDPPTLALGIQEITKGNQNMRKADERDKYSVLLDAGYISPEELSVLNIDISGCSLPIKLLEERNITIRQGKDLKNNEIVCLSESDSETDCILKVVGQQNSSGCYRYPAFREIKLWIHMTIFSVSNATCCECPDGEPTCCEVNHPGLCECHELVHGEKTFEKCSVREQKIHLAEDVLEPSFTET